MERIQEAVSALNYFLRPLVKQVLARSLADTHSEVQWDEIADRVCRDVAEFLPRDFNLITFLTQNDLYTANGRLNVDAILGAFESQVTDRLNPGERARLKHLIGYVDNTCQGITTLKRSKHHERKEEHT
jgi:hypothetical protein